MSSSDRISSSLTGSDGARLPKRSLRVGVLCCLATVGIVMCFLGFVWPAVIDLHSLEVWVMLWFVEALSLQWCYLEMKQFPL